MKEVTQKCVEFNEDLLKAEKEQGGLAKIQLDEANEDLTSTTKELATLQKKFETVSADAKKDIEQAVSEKAAVDEASEALAKIEVQLEDL